MSSAAALIEEIVLRQAGDKADWVRKQLDILSGSSAEKDLHLFMGFAPRTLGKEDLRLIESDYRRANEICVGWSLDGWSVDGAARVLGLLTFSGNRRFVDCFKDIRRTADTAELIALYRGLPLYPEPETLDFEVSEGLRTHMRSVFEAIAHNNPFPRNHFSEHRWNHMILKALFVESKLHPIIGLDERANPELARIMREYAHERWAADRTVSPELWRCVGPFADSDEAIDDLERALGGTETESKAALLALAASPHERSDEILRAHPLSEHVSDSTISWGTIAKELDK